ncbi:MAG TPA: CAP domain-containing protein, partial [Labilithrix sp.]|nr:CAP domain-containing protein [Labilithrix sp.]
HVRPRLVVASGRSPIDEKKLRPELEKRAGGAHGPARCGIAILPTPHGGEVFVALRVEALADLAPLPTRARTGEWLTLEARLHVGARSAKLIVLGPRGAPRTVPTALDPVTGIARARFALDQPGAFTVQLIAEVSEGPRPLLEARVFADMAPLMPGEEPPAPGEDAGGTGDEPLALARMIGALRALEGASSLIRDEKLDALARAHAEHMRDGQAVAHDLGDGDFRQRFEAEGTLDARAVGENVAHAPTVALAHRALHASPSHRINLLRADYTHVGVGVARAADGTVYVCETFAAARPSHTDR